MRKCNTISSDKVTCVLLSKANVNNNIYWRLDEQQQQQQKKINFLIIAQCAHELSLCTIAHINKWFIAIQ